MTDDYKLIVPRYFKGLINSYGDDIMSLDWGSETTQRLRFQLLTEIDALTSASILDVGCGRGDLLDFLIEQGFKGQYLGIDLTPEMVQLARVRHPNANFRVTDILLEDLKQKFDFVLASGIFYLRYKDNKVFFLRIVKQMYSLAKKGIAFNMLSSYTSNKKKDEYYFEPEWVFSQCKTFTHRVVLRHDYKENDFTLYLYR